MVQEMRGACDEAGTDARLGLTAGDFQHQLGARRLDELPALVDRHDEGARPADHAVFVVDVEIFDIHGAAHRAA